MRIIHRDIVGAFIFSQDGLVLLGKTEEGGVYQNTWIVPGGGIEQGETKLDALKREVIEEVGIELGENDQIELIEKVSHGQSEKTLKETDERVLVKMKFHDYIIKLDRKASEIQLRFDDDLAEAHWFNTSDIPLENLGEATKQTLKNLGFTVTSK